jgi:hypothetical protein
VGAEVNGRNEFVHYIGRVEGILLNQNYGRAKILCCPRGSSEFQKEFSQYMKNDCMKKKAMLSSKTMRHSHLTPRHLPGDHSLQQHCCQNSNLIFAVEIKNYREF